MTGATKRTTTSNLRSEVNFSGEISKLLHTLVRFDQKLSLKRNDQVRCETQFAY